MKCLIAYTADDEVGKRSWKLLNEEFWHVISIALGSRTGETKRNYYNKQSHHLWPIVATLCSPRVHDAFWIGNLNGPVS
jgi:hypothetical protein